MKDFKIVEGTAEFIEDIACQEDMEKYDMETVKFTHRSYIWVDADGVSKHKKCMYVAVFRLHRGYNAAGDKTWT